MAEVLDRDEVKKLKILNSVQRASGYDIVSISEGEAKVVFLLEQAQTMENSTTVFEGEIYKAANFTALVAVNEENNFVINANIDFLSQVEVSSKEIVFEAKSLSSSLGKKFVEVTGMIDDIKIFIGSFTILKLDARSKLKI